MTARLKEGLRAVGFMFALTLVLITSVSALYLATAERVRRNADLFLQRAVMEVAGVPVPEQAAEVAAWFLQEVEAEPAGAPTRFRVRDAASGATRAWAFTCRGRGLWGTITAVVGLSPDRSTFREFRILDQNETPGLGARIAEAWFMRQTAGKSGPFMLVPEGRRSVSPTEIDGITGATVSSVAVRDMLNGILRDQGLVKEGEQ
jgi:Na+-transporting NADH:ubiquinone oxidoreductase subunit C